MVSHLLMFGISQKFVAQSQTSGMEGPYMHGKKKTITCMDRDLKLHVMMAMLSKVIAITSCFSVQVMVDGIQKYRSALQVGESWGSMLTWLLLIFDCRRFGSHCTVYLSADIGGKIYVWP